jgi:hypothetical protein
MPLAWIGINFALSAGRRIVMKPANRHQWMKSLTLMGALVFGSSFHVVIPVMSTSFSSTVTDTVTVEDCKFALEIEDKGDEQYKIKYYKLEASDCKDCSKVNGPSLSGSVADLKASITGIIRNNESIMDQCKKAVKTDADVIKEFLEARKSECNEKSTMQDIVECNLKALKDARDHDKAEKRSDEITDILDDFFKNSIEEDLTLVLNQSEEDYERDPIDYEDYEDRMDIETDQIWNLIADIRYSRTTNSRDVKRSVTKFVQGLMKKKMKRNQQLTAKFNRAYQAYQFSGSQFDAIRLKAAYEAMTRNSSAYTQLFSYGMANSLYEHLLGRYDHRDNAEMLAQQGTSKLMMQDWAFAYQAFQREVEKGQRLTGTGNPIDTIISNRVDRATGMPTLNQTAAQLRANALSASSQAAPMDPALIQQMLKVATPPTTGRLRN